MLRSCRAPVAVFGVSLIVLLATGCKKPAPRVDPVKVAIASYKSAVEPPIQKSEEIAKLFVQIVLDDKGTPDADRAARRIETDVIPKAQEFYDKIKAISPADPNLIELHKSLVQAARLRLEGYQQIISGYNSRNLDLFSQGQKKVTESKIQEDNFIARADQIMRPYGYELVYFAAPPVISN